MHLKKQQRNLPVNQVLLSGIVRHVSVLRYTPAGLPAIEYSIECREEVENKRTLVLTIPVLAYGKWATLAKSFENRLVLLEGRLAKSQTSVLVECCTMKEVDNGICSNV